jgi:hypothetical protein
MIERRTIAAEPSLGSDEDPLPPAPWGVYGSEDGEASAALHGSAARGLRTGLGEERLVVLLDVDAPYVDRQGGAAGRDPGWDELGARHDRRRRAR